MMALFLWSVWVRVESSHGVKIYRMSQLRFTWSFSLWLLRVIYQHRKLMIWTELLREQLCDSQNLRKKKGLNWVEVFRHVHLLHPTVIILLILSLSSACHYYYRSIVILLGCFHNKTPTLSLVSMTFSFHGFMASDKFHCQKEAIFPGFLLQTFWFRSLSWMTFYTHVLAPKGLGWKNFQKHTSTPSANSQYKDHQLLGCLITLSCCCSLLFISLLITYKFFSHVNSSVSNLIWDAKLSYEYEILSQAKHSEY